MPTFKHPVKLTAEERKFLNKSSKSGSWTPRQILRAKILLLADIDGPYQYMDSVIAKELGCSLTTVFNIRKRFCTMGSIEDALFDKPRPGRPTLVDGAVEAHMTAIACSVPPEGRSQWTLRLIQDRLISLEIVDKISHTTIARELKKKKLSRG